MKNSILLLSCAMIVFACSKSESIDPEKLSPESMTSQFTNLDDLAVGQSFKYLYLIGENYYEEGNGNFEYTADTLEVEVCGFKDGKFVVQEKLTPGSAIFQSSENYLWNADSTYTSYWSIVNDTLVVEFKHPNSYYASHLFFKQTSLPLNDFDSAETQINGWKIENLFTEEFADLYLQDYELLGHQYDHLNVYPDLTETYVDGPGMVYIYSRTNGIVRTAQFSSWTGEGLGWDRL